MTNGTDPSFRLVSELSHPPGTYRLYQTDCGATCAYGLELRREFSVLGVVRVVTPVWQANNEEPASLRLSADGAVQVVRGEYVLHQFHQ